MTFMRYRILVLLLAVTMGVAYAKTKLLEDVTLEWKPTSALMPGAMELPQAAIQFATFTDQRSNPQAIGENREDDGKPKPVTTKDDVGAFVSTHMRELLSKAGLNTVDSNGTVTIKGEVKQFFVTETNTYQAQIVVHLIVVGQNGATLWSGLASGEANRFGRSYRLDNYEEALSDAIVDATSSMLKNAEFQKALAGH
jgi:Uncharacterized lipoprotein